MSNIKIIVCDLDNTIADLAPTHYLALNKALESIDEKYIISEQEHISIYNGLSTKKKLALLHKSKNFPLNKFDEVFDLKQKYTIEMMNIHLSLDLRLEEIFAKLRREGYILYVASNAIKETIYVALEKLGILHLFDKIFSNQDVKLGKPHPEIYLKSMIDAGVKPKEMLIIEDSKHGKEAAVESGAYVLGVDNPEQLTYEAIKNKINSIKPNKTKWVANNTNVLILAAGQGSRFKSEGYKLPKPLIDVNGKPMIQQVVENLNMDANYIFVVQEEHYNNYNLEVLLNLIATNCKIIKTNGVTEGAACSALLAKEFINNDDHLLIVNSDQLVSWNSSDFMYDVISKNVDGSIVVFEKYNDTKWSYAKTNENGFVIQVAEKQPISNRATIGFYQFNKGSDFVKAAEQMIKVNDRFNSEFYLAPTYNYAIKNGKKIIAYEIKAEDFHSLGTPELLEEYLKNHKN